MIIKIIEELGMFENFAGAEATLINALLSRFPRFGDEMLLHDIDVMLTVHLSDCPGIQANKRKQLGIETMYHICIASLGEKENHGSQLIPHYLMTNLFKVGKKRSSK